MLKEFLSIIAIALAFIAFLPYIRAILCGQVKPHVFSWIIWGATTFVIFLAQLADNGGAGAWPIGVSGIITIYIALLAYTKKSDISITRLDWIFFLTALAALPLWYLTRDPLWAVVILTTVDLLGLGPTFRKAYWYPDEEKLSLFILVVIRNVLSILALEHYSVTTMLFPTALSIACLMFIMMVTYRRRIMSAQPDS